MTRRSLLCVALMIVAVVLLAVAHRVIPQAVGLSARYDVAITVLQVSATVGAMCLTFACTRVAKDVVARHRQRLLRYNAAGVLNAHVWKATVLPHSKRTTIVRVAKLIVAYVLSGTMCSIVVAWVIVLYGNLGDVHHVDPEWLEHQTAKWPVSVYASSEETGMGIKCRSACSVRELNTNRLYKVNYVEVGYPVRWLYFMDSFVEEWDGSRADIGTMNLESGIELPREFAWDAYGASLPRRLPLAPMLPNMLFSIVLYTLMTAVIVKGFRTLRASNRLDLGRCPSCGYDIQYRLLEGCSECGWRRVFRQASLKSDAPVVFHLSAERASHDLEGF